jgi:hypothetical protein
LLSSFFLRNLSMGFFLNRRVLILLLLSLHLGEHRAIFRFNRCKHFFIHVYQLLGEFIRFSLDLTCVPGLALLTFNFHYMERASTLEIAIVTGDCHFGISKLFGHFSEKVLSVHTVFEHLRVTE